MNKNIKQILSFVLLGVFICLLILGGIKGNNNKKEIINEAKTLCYNQGLYYYDIFDIYINSTASSVLCLAGDGCLTISTFSHRPMWLCS